MKLLISFVNQVLTPNLKLGIFDTKTESFVWIDRGIEDFGEGAVGILIHNEKIYICMQQSELIVYDYHFNILQNYTFKFVRDPHSILYYNHNLYVVSTGTNEIYKLYLDTSGLIQKEESFWKVSKLPNYQEDLVHLNSIALLNGEFYVTMFGEKDTTGQWVNNGKLINITTNQYIENIAQPHTAYPFQNQIIYCESRHGTLNNNLGESILSLGGYTRGIGECHQYLYIGSSARRKLSKSKKKLLNGRSGELENQNDQCKITLINKKTMEIEHSFPFTNYANEIYDIVTLPTEISLPKFTLHTHPLIQVINSMEKTFLNKVAQFEAETEKLLIKISNRDQAIEKKKEELDKLHIKIDNRDEAILEKKSEISKLQIKVTNRDETITKQQEKLKHQEQLIHHKDKIIEDKQEELSKLHIKIDNRDEAILKKKSEVSILETKLDNRNTTITRLLSERDTLKRLVNNRDQQIHLLKNKIMEIGNMENIYKDLVSSDLLYQRVGINFSSKYRFGKLTKFYDRASELQSLARGNAFIKNLKNRYKGQRCFIIGNGPSLNEQNLTLLKDEFTIGSNYIYMNYEKMGFYPTIFTITNYLVAEQRIDEINALPESIKIFPYFLNYIINEDERTFFLNSAALKEFSTDLTQNISWQSTVTFFNMQLAYYLGFDEVYLIGVDNSYVQPEGGKEGAMIEQKEDDPNHFCGSYFKGLTWQKADTDAMEYVYYLTKEVFDNASQKIFNATHGGRLEVFPRVAFESLFPHANHTKLSVPITTTDRTKTLVVSINPDLENSFGHYLHYDLTIANHLSNQSQLFILANKTLSEELGKTHRTILPTFTHKSWNIGLPEQRTPSRDKQFTLELLNAIATLDHLQTNKLFYLYTGSLNHAELIYTILEAYDIPYTFHINLFREHFNVEYIQSHLTETLARLEKLSQTKQIKLYIDSEEMNETFQSLLGVTFAKWTMFPVTNFDVPTTPLLEQTPNQHLNVIFPGNLRLEKGFDLTTSAVNRLAKQNLNVYIRSTLINIKDKAIADLLTQIDNRVNIIEGVLSESAYLSLMKQADIIILPYRVSEFKTRTSGLMADALYLSKPVIAAKGTWMGNLIEQYENGVVFDDGDAQSLIDAVLKVEASIDSYRANATACSRVWREKNSVNLLIETIFGLETNNEKQD